ncbi:MAG: PfaB family protein [Pseudomonadales bacterium]|nr:PfaB family protein [Pseudomonadales bacterium]
MSDIAVIGIDAQIGDQLSVDRVERTFYLGAPLQHRILAVDADQRELTQVSQASVQRMASANGLNVSEIAIVLVSQGEANDIVQAKLADVAESCITVNSLAAALECSEHLLDEAKVVALIAANINETIDTDAAEHSASISFDADFSAYHACEGVIGLLLRPSEFASVAENYSYATIASFAANSDIAAAAETALRIANVVGEQVTLLEVSALADKNLSQQEQQALLAAYRFENPLHTAVSCARSVIGEAGALSELAGLLKTVLALHQRYIPGLNDWQQPLDKSWEDTPFYFPTEARPWFPHSSSGKFADKPHTAAYSCQTAQSYCHIVLKENLLANDQTDTRLNGFIASSDLHLLIVAADDENALQQQLADLQAKLETHTLSTLAIDTYGQFMQSQHVKYRVTLIAESIDDLKKEIHLAQAGISKAFVAAMDEDLSSASLTEWKTPKGSYFSAMPVGGNDDVAFMYPGIGATYIGLGRDLFHLFPEIYQPVSTLAEDIGSSLKDTILNPRSVNRLGFKELKALDSDLRNSLAHIAECGVGYACVFTKIFEEVFKIKADFSTGYSMGEISMYAALGCWEEPGLMSARLAKSDTFNHHLSGELRTLRNHWNLPDVEDGEKEKIWETYTIKATAEEVAEASVDEDRVYCTIINTPDSLLIGGYPEACERVIKKLGVRAMALNMPNAIHSAPAFKEYEHMEDLYTMDVTERIETKMYSSSCYLPIPQRTKAIANSIAKCLCDPVDFPRLVDTLHDKGSRVFIEMGPGRSLCSWVDKILKHHEAEGIIKPHVSLPVNAKGTADELTFIRAIAKLVSHGVTVDLHNIYHGTVIVDRTHVSVTATSAQI